MRRPAAIVGALLLLACGSEPRATRPRPVTVFAASSLTAPMNDIADMYVDERQASKPRFNFAGTSELVRQIRDGAPADVFVSADEGHMQQLVGDGLITGTPETIARNRLEIAVAP